MFEQSGFNNEIGTYLLDLILIQTAFFLMIYSNFSLIRLDSYQVDWDTRNVVDMTSMFDRAAYFNGNITHWNTSSCASMSYMFRDAVSFTRDLFWDVSSVESFYKTFNGASSFNGSIVGKTFVEYLLSRP